MFVDQHDGEARAAQDHEDIGSPSLVNGWLDMTFSNILAHIS
jgi:hypothetical protein